MKTITSWAAREPLRAFALAQAVLAALTPVLPAAVTTAVLGVLAALLGIGIRNTVTPVATATENVTRAAVDAATQVARQLDDTVAGAAGTVTVAAEQIIDRAVTGAIGNVLGKGG